MSDHENYRNEIKAYIVRAGMTMSEVVEVLADEYGWSSSCLLYTSDAADE